MYCMAVSYTLAKKHTLGRPAGKVLVSTDNSSHESI